MSEHLKYDEELLKSMQNLPLLNEDAAWEDMRSRLEKDDDNPPVVPPLFKGCGLYALLLLALIIVCLFVIDPAGWFKNKSTSPGDRNDKIEKKANTKNADETVNDKVNKNDTFRNDLVKIDSGGNSNTITKIHSDSNTSMQLQPAENGLPSAKTKTAGTTTRDISIEKEIKDSKPFVRPARSGLTRNKNGERIVTPAKNLKGRLTSKISKGEQTEEPQTQDEDAVAANNPPTNTGLGVTSNISSSKDSLKIKSADTTLTGKDTANRKVMDTTVAKKNNAADSLDKKQFYFSAGLGMQQLIPIAGQKTNPYNSLGRKNSLADYIPSLYLRFHKEKKWFIQSEFRYGAPQYTKEILYLKKIVVDTANTSSTANNSTVKKTFYHQLPVSFNAFVLPGLSLGGGVTLNRFQSALIEQDIVKTNTATQQDSVVSTGLVSQKKPDSNFVKTYFQAFAETQFNYKRFYIGVKYSFGLQPYLQFDLPGGERRKEKNSSFQFFIRYELWRSAKGR